MSEVTIGSGETKLRFSCVERDAVGRTELMRARVTAPGLDVECDAYEYGGYESLAAFFEDMAEHWRGWSGGREYYSLEGDLRIVATHDGHIRLAIQVNRHSGPGIWTVSANADLDPGEDLSNATVAVRTLVDGR